MNLAKMRYPDRFGFPDWYGPEVKEREEGMEQVRGKGEKSVLVLIGKPKIPQLCS